MARKGAKILSKIPTLSRTQLLRSILQTTWKEAQIGQKFLNLGGLPMRAGQDQRRLSSLTYFWQRSGLVTGNTAKVFPWETTSHSTISREASCPCAVEARRSHQA
jgi:hypothetical protein